MMVRAKSVVYNLKYAINLALAGTPHSMRRIEGIIEAVPGPSSTKTG